VEVGWGSGGGGTAAVGVGGGGHFWGLGVEMMVVDLYRPEECMYVVEECEIEVVKWENCLGNRL